MRNSDGMKRLLICKRNNGKNGWMNCQCSVILCIHRCFKPDSSSEELECELHYFADASEVAYGAVCYLKTQSMDGEIRISFVIGKSRLAPIKTCYYTDTGTVWSRVGIASSRACVERTSIQDRQNVFLDRQHDSTSIP